MKPWLWLAFFLGFTPLAQAAGVCGLSISAGNITVDWSLNYTIKSFPFTITKANAPRCDYGIGFTKGTATDYTTRRATSGTNTVPYQLYPDTTKANILKDKGDILVAGEAIMDTYLDGATGQHFLQYYVDIPYAAVTSPSLVASGTYTETYTLNVYEGADPTLWGAPVASAPVTITVNVPKIIALSLVDSGGNFDDSKTIRNANFGMLTPGQAVNMDVRIRSNAGYQISFSSSNAGNLKHVTGNSTVPYQLYVNSALVTLPGTAMTTNGTTPLGGLGYSIRSVIAPFSGAGRLAGQYSDQITVTATTTE